MSKSMILLITIFALWVFLILFKKGNSGSIIKSEKSIAAGIRT